MTAKAKSATERPAKARAGTVGNSGTEKQPTGSPQSGSPAKRDSKTERVVTLLSRAEGATLPEIISLTGWQPHSARAALTGLRKKGHDIERTKRDDATCYRIAVAKQP
jgi:hypothetical protein